MSGVGVADDLIRSFFERWQRLEEEKAAISEDLRELFAEMKSNGLDTKVARKVFRDKTVDQDERAEFEAIYDLYWSALSGPRAGRAREGMVDHFADKSEEIGSDTNETGRFAASTTSEEIDPSTGEITEPSQAHTEVGSEQAAASAPLEAAAETDMPETANEHPHRLETTRGDESGTLEGSVEDHGQAAGRYPECRTDGIGNRDSAERRAPHSPEATASPVALVIHHDESREARSLRLRPHCQRPNACAGVGTTHCYSCKRAITSMNGGDAA